MHSGLCVFCETGEGTEAAKGYQERRSITIFQSFNLSIFQSFNLSIFQGNVRLIQVATREIEDTKKWKKNRDCPEICADGWCLMKQCLIIVGGKPFYVQIYTHNRCYLWIFSRNEYSQHEGSRSSKVITNICSNMFRVIQSLAVPPWSYETVSTLFLAEMLFLKSTALPSETGTGTGTRRTSFQIQTLFSLLTGESHCSCYASAPL